VFAGLVKSNPEKPQVHYLLGYLRDEEGNSRDALPEFREAVRLDPDYLNAWKKIANINNYSVHLPAAECDSVQLNILRLDPLGRHSTFEAGRMVDLAAAWNATETAAKLRKTAEPAALYPLTGSVEEMATQKKEADAYAAAMAAHPNPNPNININSRMEYKKVDLAHYGRPDNSYPGGMIAGNAFMQAVSQMYFYGDTPNAVAPSATREDW